MNVSALIRNHLLARVAPRSPWLLDDVQFALRRSALEEDLEAYGLRAWFQPLFEAHRAEIEAALDGAEAVFVSAGRHRLALLPFSVRGEIDWTPDPLKEDWTSIAGRYAPPRDRTPPPAPRVEVLPRATVAPGLEEPQKVMVAHPWEHVASITARDYLKPRYLARGLSVQEALELPRGQVYLPGRPTLEEARVEVARALAHAWSSGRVEPASAALVAGYLEAHGEEVARAILEGPRVLVLGPDDQAILPPSVPLPKAARVLTTDGFLAASDGLVTVQGALELVRYEGLLEGEVRAAVFTYPDDPQRQALADALERAHPKSPLVGVLRRETATFKQPTLLVEYTDGTMQLFGIGSAKKAVAGVEANVYVAPKRA